MRRCKALVLPKFAVLLAVFCWGWIGGDQARAQDAKAEAEVQAERPQIVQNAKHQGGLDGVAFSRDGRLLLSAGFAVRLWDTESGRLIRTFEADGDADAVAFSADQKSAIVATNVSLMAYDLATGKPRAFKDTDSSYYNVDISPDGEMITAAMGNEIGVWNYKSGALLTRFRVKSQKDLHFLKLAIFLPGGQRIASGNDDGMLNFHDLSGRDFGGIQAHQEPVVALANLSKGTEIATGSDDGSVKIWDILDRRLVREFKYSSRVKAIALTSDEKFLISLHGDNAVIVWDITSGKQVQTFRVADKATDPAGLTLSADDKWLITSSKDDEIQKFDWRSGKLVTQFGSGLPGPGAVTISSDGEYVATAHSHYAFASPEGRIEPPGSIVMRKVSTGEVMWTASRHGGFIYSLVFADSARQVISGAEDGKIIVTDSATGEMLREVEASPIAIQQLMLSPDEKFLASIDDNGEIKLWNLADLTELRSYDSQAMYKMPIAFSHDGKLIAATGNDDKINILDRESGELILQYGGRGTIFGLGFSADDKSILLGMNYGQLLIKSIYSKKKPVATKLDGVSEIVAIDDKVVVARIGARYVWVRTSDGKVLSKIDGSGKVASGADVSGDTFVVKDGKLITVQIDGRIRIWDIEKQRLLTTSMASENGDWTMFTPDGYYFGSTDPKEFSVVKGMKVYPMSRFHGQLSRKDLIDELLAGDKHGLYADAVSKLDLELVLESGPVPKVTLLKDSLQRAGNSVRATVRIVDTGGGIGQRVIWRLNGQSQGQTTTPKVEADGTVRMTNTIYLDPSISNEITVTAYNGTNLMSAEPLRFTIDKFGATPTGGPRLYVLAVGVGPSAKMPEYRLEFPEKDAEAFATMMKTVGANLFSGVETTTLIGEDATRAKIAQSFERMGKAVQPKDVFILFLSGHGMSRVGKYYFVPQDFDTASQTSWEQSWIGQDQWSDWLGKIFAKKQLLIIDTCESGGALGLVKGQSAQETAMDQLNYATGRSIISAAQSVARESSQLGHGVLTYAVLETFKSADASETVNDKPITVFDLARKTQQSVFDIRRRIWGEPIGTVSRLADNDFPLGFPANFALQAPSANPQDSQTRYVILTLQQARSGPSETDSVNREVDRGTEITVFEFLENGWALVGKDGIKWGYVPADSVIKLK